MTLFSERLAILIDAKTGGAVSEINKVSRSAEDLGTKTGPVSKGLQSLGISGASSGVALKAGLAVGAAAAAVGIEQLASASISKFADATAQVRAFQRVTGASAEDSSRLVASFNVLGVDSDKAGTAVFRLAKNIDSSQKALEKHGITIAKSADGGVDLTNTFLNIADAVHAVGAGFEADSIVAAAFGSKVGASLLPVLLRGRDGLQELFDAAAQHHEIFTQADLDKGKQFNLATAELHQSLVGLEIEGGRALVPLATAIVNTTESFIRGVDKIGHLPFIDRFAKGLGVIWDFVARNLGIGEKAGTDLTALADAAKKAAEAMTTQETTVTDLATATKSLNSANDKLANDEKAIADATAARSRATADLATAQEDLTRAIRDEPLNRAKANEDATAALDAVADKTRAVTIANEEYGAGTIEAKKAADDLAASQIDASIAANKAADLKGKSPDVVSAEQHIADLKKTQADQTDTIAKTTAQLSQDHLDILSTQYKENDAIVAFNQQFGTALTIADALNGKVDETIAKYEQVLLDQQKANNPLLTPLQTGEAGPLLPGQVRLAGPAVPPQFRTVNGGDATRPLIGPPVPTAGTTNITVIAQSNASAQDIAKEVAFLGRAR